MGELCVALCGVPTAAVPDGVREVRAPGHELLSLAASSTDDALTLLLASATVAPRNLEVARASSAGDHVVVHGEPLPVSRVCLLAEALVRTAGSVPTGVLLAALPELREHVTCRVVLSSVGSLTDPAPDLRQHAGGWLPGSRFVTDMRQVHTKRHPERFSAGDPYVVVLHGPGDTSRTWAAELVEEAGATSAVAWPGASPWSCAQWAEVSAWDRPLEQIVQEVLDPLPQAACAWCGRTALADRECPFCHVVVDTVMGRTS